MVDARAAMKRTVAVRASTRRRVVIIAIITGAGCAQHQLRASNARPERPRAVPNRRVAGAMSAEDQQGVVDRAGEARPNHLGVDWTHWHRLTPVSSFHVVVAQVGGQVLPPIDAIHTHRLYPRAGPLCNNSHVNLDQPKPNMVAPCVYASRCAVSTRGALAGRSCSTSATRRWQLFVPQCHRQVSFCWGASTARVAPDGGVAVKYLALYGGRRQQSI